MLFPESAVRYDLLEGSISYAVFPDAQMTCLLNVPISQASLCFAPWDCCALCSSSRAFVVIYGLVGLPDALACCVF